ncbi:hypothetical protein SAMN06272722_11756 [Paenibacillus sp. RU5A]|nr:hypothetical protein SAMN06272722_11756 [Paenibacillus sp. RU5A]SOC76391.1 hypothetical protein SAMN05880581_11756 [Paenibacillus sp. RU26A]SOC77923.1 hypothetical protein SAMN05880586_11725 [Paenibacillus sp. RU5M]
MEDKISSWLTLFYSNFVNLLISSQPCHFLKVSKSKFRYSYFVFLYSYLRITIIPLK